MSKISGQNTATTNHVDRSLDWSEMTRFKIDSAKITNVLKEMHEIDAEKSLMEKS